MEELYYGPVLVKKGKYKGKAGIYDDDEEEMCIVYLDGMFSKECNYVLIRRDHLEQTELPVLFFEKFKKENPTLAAMLGY